MVRSDDKVSSISFLMHTNSTYDPFPNGLLIASVKRHTQVERLEKAIEPVLLHRPMSSVYQYNYHPSNRHGHSKGTTKHTVRLDHGFVLVLEMESEEHCDASLAGSIFALRGLLQYLQPTDSAHLWSPDGLNQLGIYKHTDVFNLPADHAAVKLQQSVVAFDRLIAPVGRQLQVQRIEQLLKPILVRRTMSTILDTNKKLPIGVGVPRVEHTTLHISLNKASQAIYDELLIANHKKLFSFDRKSQRAYYNPKILNMLILTGTWTQLGHYAGSLKLDDFSTLKQQPKLLNYLYSKTEAGKDQLNVESVHEIDTCSKLCQDSPKLSILAHDVADFVVKGRRNMLIFVATPANGLIVEQFLKVQGINAVYAHSKISLNVRAGIYKGFNKRSELATTGYYAQGMVMIVTYGTGSEGHNWQYACNLMVLYDTPPSILKRDQAKGRLVRYGNPFDTVVVCEYCVEGTLSSKIMADNLHRALPSLLVAMDKMPGGHAKDVIEGDPGEATNWVFHKGHIYGKDDVRVSHLELPLLDPEHLLKMIVFLTRGKVIVVLEGERTEDREATLGPAPPRTKFNQPNIDDKDYSGLQ